MKIKETMKKKKMKFMKLMKMPQQDFKLISNTTIICLRISMFKNIQFIKLMWGCRIQIREEELALGLIILLTEGLIVHWRKEEHQKENNKLLFKINKEEQN